MLEPLVTCSAGLPALGIERGTVGQPGAHGFYHVPATLERDNVACRSVAPDELLETLGILRVGPSQRVGVRKDVAQHLVVDADTRIAVGGDRVQCLDEVDQAGRLVPVERKDRLQLCGCGIGRDTLDADLTDRAGLARNLELNLLPAAMGCVYHLPSPLPSVFFRLVVCILVEHLVDVARGVTDVGSELRDETAVRVDTVGKSTTRPYDLVAVVQLVEDDRHPALPSWLPRKA